VARNVQRGEKKAAAGFRQVKWIVVYGVFFSTGAVVVPRAHCSCTTPLVVGFVRITTVLFVV
jgi:hypothetical protein